jgi:hypothetical protein
MHLLETYALSCGLKINRPYVFENYTTVPFDRFISFNKVNYPYFPEVVQLIKPELDKRGIAILQLKANPQNIENDVAVFDNLQFGQYAYTIKHSLLHFGEDDFLFDLAGYYDIPRVIMFSNTYPASSKPYWGSPDKERILSSTGPWAKPSLNADPNQSFVRFIKPEQIAAAVMELLGIEWKAPYETVYPGTFYRAKHDIIELIPQKGTNVNLNGPVQSVTLRMDYQYDEQYLGNILQQTRASIVTDRPIPTPLIRALRPNIQEILYIVGEDGGNLDFARDLVRLNITHNVTTYQDKTSLKAITEKFFEICPVNQIPISNLADIKELRNGIKGLFYKSGKRIFLGQDECKSKFELANKMQSKPNDFSPCPDGDNTDFLKELEFFFLVKLT